MLSFIITLSHVIYIVPMCQTLLNELSHFFHSNYM